MSCLCSVPNIEGDYEPCCDHTGICTAYYTEDNFSSCICCGAEMQKDELGIWRHYSQTYEIPEERYTMHHMQDKPK